MFAQPSGESDLRMHHRDWLGLVLLIVAAIAFRFIYLSKAYSIGFDEVNYLKLAASGRLNGLNHVFHSYWSPFYPLMVALFSFIIPDFESAARWLTILCAVSIIFPMFFFLKDHFNRKIGFVVSALILFFPFSASFSVKAETEFLYMLVSISGMILGWDVLNKRRKLLALLVGGLFGLSYLTRPEGVGFLLTFWGFTILLMIFYLFIKEKITPYFIILLFSIIGFGIVSFPYLYFLKQQTGEWTISTKGKVNQLGEYYVKNKEQYGENPFHTLSPDNKRLPQDEIYHQGTFVTQLQKAENSTPVQMNFKGLLVKVLENYYKLLGGELAKVLTLPLIILFGLGFLGHAWSRSMIILNFYLLSYLIFFWLLLIPIFHITHRYFIPLLPVCFIWVGIGLIDLIKWIQIILSNIFARKSDWWPIRYGSVMVVMLLIFMGSFVLEFGKQMKQDINSIAEWDPAIEQKKAGLWIKENVHEKGPIIMAYNHAVSFYAGNYNINESVEIPENDVTRLLAYARHRNVRYLVLDDRYKHHFPLIANLFEEKDVPADLKKVYDNLEKNGLKTIIYEILYQ